MKESHEYQLTFVSNTLEEIKINIPYADPDLDPIEAAGFMQGLIDCNIIVTATGEPAMPKGLVLKSVNVEAIDFE